jgi:hypothetical protein
MDNEDGCDYKKVLTYNENKSKIAQFEAQTLVNEKATKIMADADYIHMFYDNITEGVYVLST